MFSDDIFKYILFNELFRILIHISLQCVPRGPIDNRSIMVDGLVPNRHLINADPVHWRIYASLGESELTRCLIKTWSL